MNTVDPIWLLAFQQVDHVSRTPYSSHNHVILYGNFHLDNVLLHGPLHSPADTKVTTTRAPFEVVFGVLFAHAPTSSVC